MQDIDSLIHIHLVYQQFCQLYREDRAIGYSYEEYIAKQIEFYK